MSHFMTIRLPRDTKSNELVHHVQEVGFDFVVSTNVNSMVAFLTSNEDAMHHPEMDSSFSNNFVKTEPDSFEFDDVVVLDQNQADDGMKPLMSGTERTYTVLKNVLPLGVINRPMTALDASGGHQYSCERTLTPEDDLVGGLSEERCPETLKVVKTEVGEPQGLNLREKKGKERSTTQKREKIEKGRIEKPKVSKRDKRAGEYPCEICNRVLLRKDSLTRHMRTVHGPLEKHVRDRCDRRHLAEDCPPKKRETAAKETNGCRGKKNTTQ